MNLEQLLQVPLSFYEAVSYSALCYALTYVAVRVCLNGSRAASLFLSLVPFCLAAILPSFHSATMILLLQLFGLLSTLSIGVISFFMATLFGEKGIILTIKASCFWFALSGLFFLHRAQEELESWSGLSEFDLSMIVVVLLTIGFLTSIFRFLQSSLQLVFWTACLGSTFFLISDQQAVRKFLPEDLRAFLGLPASMHIVYLDSPQDSVRLDSSYLEQYLNTVGNQASSRYSIRTFDDSLETLASAPGQLFELPRPDLLVISDRSFQTFATEVRSSNELLGRFESALKQIVEVSHAEGVRVVFFISAPLSSSGSLPNDALRKRMMHCAREFEVPYIDGSDLKERLFPHGHHHVTEDILRVVQEYLADHLLKKLHH